MIYIYIYIYIWATRNTTCSTNNQETMKIQTNHIGSLLVEYICISTVHYFVFVEFWMININQHLSPFFHYWVNGSHSTWLNSTQPIYIYIYKERERDMVYGICLYFIININTHINRYWINLLLLPKYHHCILKTQI